MMITFVNHIENLMILTLSKETFDLIKKEEKFILLKHFKIFSENLKYYSLWKISYLLILIFLKN